MSRTIETVRRQPATIVGADLAPHRSFSIAWTQIIHRSSKTTALKFALARLLLDIAAKSPGATRITVQREQLAEHFVRYFWYQVCLFRLRQAPHWNQEPLVVRLLKELEISRRDVKKGPAAVGNEKLNVIHAKLTARGFTYVLACFHNIGSRRTASRRFFKRTGRAILIPPSALRFLRDNHQLLRDSLNFHWARWLENFNTTAPGVAGKVEFSGNYERKGLRAWGDQLRKHESGCFYCGRALRSSFEVEHFIPWSYLFQDPKWNLVLACKECNRNKFDELPPRRYIVKLCERFDALVKVPTLATELQRSADSLPRSGTRHSFQQSVTQLYDAAKLDGLTVVDTRGLLAHLGRRPKPACGR